MARIVRHSLRMRSLPLLSMPQPWGLVADAGGLLPVGVDEPRYLQLARKIGAPRGTLLYGYTETGQVREGGLGVLVKVEQIRWLGCQSLGHEAVHLTGRGVQPFRVLAIKPVEVAGGEPLYTAHVQLLPMDLAKASTAQQAHHGMMGVPMSENEQGQRVWESGMLGSGPSTTTQTGW
mmetsp:Transcript_94130/g.292804  ORF Transcript_94130/g.292804 Transcript_94130/m.292804 type:complete len:177 (-) Transcript_94130:284-814(-)